MTQLGDFFEHLHDSKIPAAVIDPDEASVTLSLEIIQPWPDDRHYDLNPASSTMSDSKTSATLMIAGGVPPKVAGERLGHADPTLFTNIYSHVTPTMKREAAEKIGSILLGRDRRRSGVLTLFRLVVCIESRSPQVIRFG